ncbi:MAG: sigma-54-dependent Fis family transcriptional regulator [Peptococcaceae bacterium]|nr:sigma-54-dependent Fis family transcriptional regulator [Peptococcaceae bacterium]
MNVAETSVPVMIYGESGTGKEMFAQAIHSASSRNGGPFIAINCGAMPGELVESELFGYEEGSFTGALRGGKIGKIEAASGGTLFLDEIESMPLKDQIKLLRVLSTGKVQKIGSTKEITVDVRLISATKIDLLKQADKGLFREDLFYRISTFIIELPPLKDRKADIVLLAEEFVKKLEKKYHLKNIEMDKTFINALCSYHWRGNVRELEHTMERAVIMLRGEHRLCRQHLSDKILDGCKKSIAEEVVENVMENDHGLLAVAERMLIERVLESVNGNVSAAAEQLGINRRTIYKKMGQKDNFRLIK